MGLHEENYIQKFQQNFPEKLPRVRLMVREDAHLLSRWVEKGRLEGVFQSGSKLDADIVLEYHDRIRRSGWHYLCQIIEDGDHPIGYIDYKYRKYKAELLGLYLEPQFRLKRIGQHIIRWAVADLRERGCKRAIVKCYSDNVVSLHACRATGFRFAPKCTHLKEKNRIVKVLYRRIEPFLRLSSKAPLYSCLQGENIFLHHVALAEALTEKVKKLRGVVVVLGLGSIARGFAEQGSDLAITVLRNGPSLKRSWRGGLWLAGVQINLILVDLQAASHSDWDDFRRQSFEESVVLFARDLSGVRAVQNAIHLKINMLQSQQPIKTGYLTDF